MHDYLIKEFKIVEKTLAVHPDEVNSMDEAIELAKKGNNSNRVIEISGERIYMPLNEETIKFIERIKNESVSICTNSNN